MTSSSAVPTFIVRKCCAIYEWPVWRSRAAAVGQRPNGSNGPGASWALPAWARGALQRRMTASSPHCKNAALLPMSAMRKIEFRQLVLGIGRHKILRCVTYGGHRLC